MRTLRVSFREIARIFAVFVSFGIITSAARAADISVTVDTGSSVTLNDFDGDGYYDIGSADEVFMTIIHTYQKSCKILI